MTEENPGQQSKQGEEPHSGSIVAGTPAPTVIVQPAIPPATIQDVPRPDPVRELDQELKPVERKTLNLAWAGLIVAVVAAIVAVVTGIIFYCQFREMRAQTTILSGQAQQAAKDSLDSGKKAEEQLRISRAQVGAAQNSVKAIQRQSQQDQRGWVVFDTDYSDKTEFSDYAPLGLQFKLINFGKTPAKNLTGIIEVNELTPTEDPDFHYVTGHPRSSIHIGIIYPTENFAHTSIAYELNHDAKPKPVILTPAAHEKFVRGQIVFAIHGKITYHDIFDRWHWLTFCHIIGTDPRLKKESCTNHNNVDKN